ncbi:MAG: winged helix-turn-helix transcriptional regulator [Acidimicrobiia bacterium]|nr:winged helix-turn-helix transcriptional regulator [Acidimicrobiia bacterium]
MNRANQIGNKALERKSLSQQVASAIRSSILDGELELGQKLRDMELALAYGVSSSVVREALNILQGEGLVVADPYRGRA